MKNSKVIKWLGQFDPTAETEIVINFNKWGINETTYHIGEWKGHEFAMEAFCNWKRGSMMIHPEVGELIEMLTEKRLDEMDDTDLPDLELHETSDGNIDFGDIEWESQPTEEELEEIDYYDLYCESDINECEYTFSAGDIWSMEIEVNGQTYMLEGDEEDN
jgi:hypothetical protein